MKEEEQIKLLQDLRKKIDDIQTKLDQNPKTEIHLTIENATIETFQLDELVYHLDKINVKELSGMLNLGNSFSPKIHSKSQKSSSSVKSKECSAGKKESNEKNQKSVPRIKINEREINYRFEGR